MRWRTRDTRATCHNRVAVAKREHFLKSPALQYISDSIPNIFDRDPLTVALFEKYAYNNLSYNYYSSIIK